MNIRQLLLALLLVALAVVADCGSEDTPAVVSPPPTAAPTCERTPEPTPKPTKIPKPGKEKE